MTSFLTVAGVGLGVAALTVVTSVWNGFETEFLDKLLGINAHAVVLRRFDVFRDHVDTRRLLAEQEEIRQVTPFVYSEVIVQSGRGARGVAIKGVDPELSTDLPLASYVERTGSDPSAVFGTLEVDTSTDAHALPGMVVGRDLQQALHVEVGDPVTIISPYGGKGGQARTAQFRVAGVFHSGMFEFDSRMVFIGLSEAQRFFKLFDTVTGLEVWTEDPMRSLEIIERALLPLSEADPIAFEVKDWSVTNQGVFGAVSQQKIVITGVLFFIVLVAAFNIMATLILIILEKRREIAVLRSIGATQRSILTIFFIDGQLIGLAGCAAGLAMGLIVCGLVGRYGLSLDPRVYYLENLPVVVEPLEILAILAGAMLCATVASLIPAQMAAVMSPVDGLTERRGR